MIKRRLFLVGENRYRADLTSGETTFFSIQDNTGIIDWGRTTKTFPSYPWGVEWEGVSLESFERQEDALCFVIRFVYNIAQYHLIPSEILADFGLAYKSGDWVDEWFRPARREVVFTPGGVKRPQDRKIRYQEWKRGFIDDFPKREKRKNRLLEIVRSFRRPKRPKRPKRPELTDEECLFTLKSGLEAEKAHEERKKRNSDLRE